MEDQNLKRVRKHLFTSVASIPRTVGKQELEITELSQKYRESFGEPLSELLKRAKFNNLIDAAAHPDACFTAERQFDNKFVIRVKAPQGISHILAQQITSEAAEKEQKKINSKRKTHGFNSLLDNYNSFSSACGHQAPSKVASSPKKSIGEDPPKAQIAKKEAVRLKKIVSQSSSDEEVLKLPRLKKMTTKESSEEEDRKPIKPVTKKVVQMKEASSSDSSSSISDDEPISASPINRITVKKSSGLADFDEPSKQAKEAPVEKKQFGHRNSPFYGKTKPQPKFATNKYSSDSTVIEKQVKPRVQNHSVELDCTSSIKGSVTMAKGWQELLYLELGRELMENSDEAREIAKVMPVVKRVMEAVFTKLELPAEK